MDHPHNLVLDLLMSSGALGLAAFLSILWTFYARSSKALRETAGSEDGMLYAAVVSSATAFLIQAQFNPNVIVLWILFWTSLAIGSAAWDITVTRTHHTDDPPFQFLNLDQQSLQIIDFNYTSKANSRVIYC